MSIDTTKWNS